MTLKNNNKQYLKIHCARHLPYSEGEEWQIALRERMLANQHEHNHLVFVEHTPVITCGRSGNGANLLISREQLVLRNIDYHEVKRGGDVTYHGPGQWTVYPIVRLDYFARDLHNYMRILEECIIKFLQYYDIEGIRRKGMTGVWVADKKIAAIGIAVNRWIAWHGFAINIQPDLSPFLKLMIPCGISAEKGSVTSLAELTGKSHDMLKIKEALTDAFAEVTGMIIK